MRQAARRDSNEKSILAFFEGIGAAWIRHDIGCDGFLLYAGQLYIIEIKTPATRSHLTRAERFLRLKATLCNVPYYVITSVEEAAEMLGVEI